MKTNNKTSWGFVIPFPRAPEIGVSKESYQEYLQAYFTWRQVVLDLKSEAKDLSKVRRTARQAGLPFSQCRSLVETDRTGFSVPVTGVVKDLRVPRAVTSEPVGRLRSEPVVLQGRQKVMSARGRTKPITEQARASKRRREEKRKQRRAAERADALRTVVVAETKAAVAVKKAESAGIKLTYANVARLPGGRSVRGAAQVAPTVSTVPTTVRQSTGGSSSVAGTSSTVTVPSTVGSSRPAAKAPGKKKK